MASFLITQGKMNKSVNMMTHHKCWATDVLNFARELVSIGKMYSEYDYDKWVDFFHENAIKDEWDHILMKMKILMWDNHV